MIDYYGPDGNPISRDEYLELNNQLDVKRVAADRIGYYWISTVWLGLDHAFDGGPPLIFETMIFSDTVEGTDWLEEYCERYSTRDEALRGHERAIEKVLCIRRA